MRSSFFIFSFIPVGFCFADVVINEIHYHPVEEPAFDADYNPVMDLSEDVHEFIELHNTGDEEVSLSAWEFTRGVKFNFPSGTSIEAGGYIVVAKDPARLRNISQYDALTEENVLGPWSGILKNTGERIVLNDHHGIVVDSVEYRSEFPWPVTANGLGETRRWPDLDLDSVQYRGSSLERVSTTVSGDLPENWRASVPLANPSPGRANAILADVPAPVVTFLELQQSDNRESVIRPFQAARVSCAFSSEDRISSAVVEYFIDDVDRTDETILSVVMSREVFGERVLYRAEIPGQAEGQIIRYRIKANRAAGDPVLSPRVDDPYDWYAYSPWNGDTDGGRYEIYYSNASQSQVDFNLRFFDPLTLSDRDYFGESRSSGWNGTAPGVFVRDGEVWDIHWRYQGSPFRRNFSVFVEEVPPMKIKFPRDHRMDGERSILLTHKEDETLDGHRLFQFVGLPVSDVSRVSVTVNGSPAVSMLQINEMNDSMLAQYRKREHARTGVRLSDESGWIVKASGLKPNFAGLPRDVGPWGSGDGVPLIERAIYSPLERYSWTYPLKNQDWRGYVPFHQMLLDHPGASGSDEELRAFFNTQWDVDQAFDYYATAEWAGFWDDDGHNYFYYRAPNGKWMILPWDFDNVFFNRNLRSHIFEFTIKKAFRESYNKRLFQLNNTILHEHNLIANQIDLVASNFAETRRVVLNQQLGLGEYTRPITPSLIEPFSGVGHHPGAPFTTSEYFHQEEKTHIATLWEFREAGGDYLDPVYRVRSSVSLTSLVLPPNILRVGERYAWRVTYIDSDNHESLISSEQEFVAGAGKNLPGAIRFSEVVAHNSATTEHDGQFPDWVEIENIISVDIPLDGMSLSSDPSGPSFTFPAGAVLPANSRVVVWLSELVEGGTGFYSGFGLSKEGDSLILSAPNSGTLDAISFGPQPDGTSLARYGNTNWKLSVPTLLASNVETPLADSSSLRITEWMADPEDGADWLELYNTSALPVALGGLTLEDASGEKTTFPPHSFLSGREYYQLFAEGEAEKGPNHLNFSLSSHSEELILRGSDGVLIDRVSFWDQEEGISEGRLSDFVGIARFTVPTPEGENLEPDQDFDGMPDRWENEVGLDPNDAADAPLDPDRDGFTNLEEYSANTNPLDDSDFLSATVKQLNENVLIISFPQKIGRFYMIERLEMNDTWTGVKSILPEETSRTRQENIAFFGSGVYRVRVSLSE